MWFTRCVFCGVGSFNLTFDECSIQQWYYPAFFAAGSYLAGFFFVTIFHYTIFVFFVQSLCGGLLFALLYMFCILVFVGASVVFHSVMLSNNCISSLVQFLFVIVFLFIFVVFRPQILSSLYNCRIFAFLAIHFLFSSYNSGKLLYNLGKLVFFCQNTINVPNYTIRR